MIEFMIIAAPRSGTTWAANWLTTDTTMCFHDPLIKWRMEELDRIQSKKRIGIACTALGFFPDWLNSHPARKVILHRDFEEVTQSLIEIGLTEMPKPPLREIIGHHHKWTDIFERPKEIYEYLLQMPFDEERHTELKAMEIQPDFEGLVINKSITKTFVKQLTEALE